MGTNDYCDWRSLREIDRAAGRAKGTAFRAFKARLKGWREGEDFLVLDHRSHAGLAARLHAEDRLYASSVNPVLLAPAAAAALLATLSESKPSV